MKKITAVLLIVVCCVLFSACNGEENKTEITTPTTQLTTSESTTAAMTTQPTTNTTIEPITQVPETTAINKQETQAQSVEQTEQTEQTSALTSVSVVWEDNDAVQALKELCKDQPLTIAMSMYGGFEQVGSIGTALPQNDMQTTTSAGDIVLYSGDQMVVFYGSNTWAYTRLGHISDQSADGMAELLSNGDTVITVSLG